MSKSIINKFAFNYKFAEFSCVRLNQPHYYLSKIRG